MAREVGIGLVDKIFSKKTFILLLLLVIVIISFNSKWVWQIMYPVKYEKEVNQSAISYNLDPYLILAIIQVETGFKKDVVSKKGAIGLMQLMPDTATWIVDHGKFPDYLLNNLTVPKVNIILGSWYLAYIIEKYEGNTIASIAAYNAGPGNVDKWLKNGIWDGTEQSLEQIPFGETRHYLQRVIYFYNHYQWIYEDEF